MGIVAILGLLISVTIHYRNGLAGGQLQFRASVDSGTVTLSSKTHIDTWHVHDEWVKTFVYDDKAFNTPRTLTVIPDSPDTDGTAHCEILFSGRIIAQDTMEKGETAAICQYVSWNQETFPAPVP